MTHARLSPSSSSRWLQCTASVKATENYPSTTNSAAEWGTNAHFIGEQLLNGREIKVGEMLTEGDRNPFRVDEELLQCSTEYAEYVQSFIKKDSVVIIEEQYDLSCISPDQFGTSDATVLDGTHLHIFDLKSGRGIVMAKMNTQMMLYAIGAVEELGDIYDIHTVTLHIVQTRAGHIDSWDLDIADLMSFKTFAQTQAKRILDDNVSFDPSEKACQWCDHKVHCETLKTHVDSVITGQFDDIEDVEGKANLIDHEHIANILKNKELIIGFMKAVEEFALTKMQEGEEFKGFKLVEAKTNRKWIDEEAVAKYLNRKIKPAELWVKKLIPMTKILKLRPKDKKLEEMLVKPEGKPTIAKNSDPRPPLSAVADEFDEV